MVYIPLYLLQVLKLFILVYISSKKDNTPSNLSTTPPLLKNVLLYIFPISSFLCFSMNDLVDEVNIIEKGTTLNS